MARINLYQTPEHECPYLEDRISVTQFIDPERTPDIDLYTQLTHYGFRRSGDHIYRPSCPECDACQSIRLPVMDLKLTKSQKRVRNSGRGFEVRVTRAVSSDEHYALYERYINERHKDGDMYPPSRELYDNFLLSEWAESFYLEIRNNDQLIACAVFDKLHDGYSAVYSFFEPDYPKLSLGTLCIIKQMELIQTEGLLYLYLGYQIDGCRKMNYKTRFKPYQIYQDGLWLTQT